MSVDALRHDQSLSTRTQACACVPTFGARFAAFVLDLMTVGGLAIVAFTVAPYGDASWPAIERFGVIAPSMFLYVGIMLASTGTTIGLKLLGLRIVSSRLQRPSTTQAFVRSAALFAALMCPVILLLGALDPLRRAHHDLISRTFVIYADQDAERRAGPLLECEEARDASRQNAWLAIASIAMCAVVHISLLAT